MQHRIAQQGAGVMALAAEEHSEAGDGGKDVFRTLAVCRPIAATAAGRGADHQGDGELREMAGKLDRMIVDLVGAKREEIGEHDFNDRPVAGKREADRSTGESPLADRRRDDAPGVALRQAGGDFESAAIGIVQVLTHHDRSRVIVQKPVNGGVQGGADGSGGGRDVGQPGRRAEQRGRFPGAGCFGRGRGRDGNLDDQIGDGPVDAGALLGSEAIAEAGNRVSGADEGNFGLGPQIIPLAVRAKAAGVDHQETRPPRGADLIDRLRRNPPKRGISVRHAAGG